MTNAIRNSLKVNPSGQPSDGPMGISVALSPTTVVSTVSRAITNASFRAKKLPGMDLITYAFLKWYLFLYTAKSENLLLLQFIIVVFFFKKKKISKMLIQTLNYILIYTS